MEAWWNQFFIIIAALVGLSFAMQAAQLLANIDWIRLIVTFICLIAIYRRSCSAFGKAAVVLTAVHQSTIVHWCKITDSLCFQRFRRIAQVMVASALAACASARLALRALLPKSPTSEECIGESETMMSLRLLAGGELWRWELFPLATSKIIQVWRAYQTRKNGHHFIASLSQIQRCEAFGDGIEFLLGPGFPGYPAQETGSILRWERPVWGVMLGQGPEALIRVGHLFLRAHIKVPVLTVELPDMCDFSESNQPPRPSMPPKAFWADNSYVGSDLDRVRNPGVSFCTSMQWEARSDTNAYLPWGAVVQGELIGEDWVQVGDLFLPARVPIQVLTRCEPEGYSIMDPVNAVNDFIDGVWEFFGDSWQQAIGADGDPLSSRSKSADGADNSCTEFADSPDMEETYASSVDPDWETKDSDDDITTRLENAFARAKKDMGFDVEPDWGKLATWITDLVAEVTSQKQDEPEPIISIVDDPDLDLYGVGRRCNSSGEARGQAAISSQEGDAGRPPVAPCDFNGYWICKHTWGLKAFLEEEGFGLLTVQAATCAPWPSWEFFQNGNSISFVCHGCAGDLTEAYEVDGGPYKMYDGHQQLLQCQAFWEKDSLVIVRSGPQGCYQEHRHIDANGRLNFTLTSQKQDKHHQWGRIFERG